MRELVEYMAKSLVDHPDQVRVKESQGRDTVIHLRVAPEDIGRVIGKSGRVANAMRALVRVAAIRNGNRVTLDIE